MILKVIVIIVCGQPPCAPRKVTNFPKFNEILGVTSVKNDDLDLFKNANYFTKYFSKGFQDSENNQRSFNQKRYLNSSGLRMPKVIDICLSDKEFSDLILENREYIKSMGLKNDVGSRVIIDNDLIDKYLYGEKNDR